MEAQHHEQVAANVRAAMARQRVSQRQVAVRLGISQPAMSARLAGRTPIDVGELLTIADVLDVPPATLLGGAA